MSRQPWAEVRAVLQRDEHPKPEATVVRLKRFVEMLLQWNLGVSNLISKNDEERIVAAHVLPTIEAAGWLKSFNLNHWCDLGSGGGFPAIPLALCGVGVSWDLVESRRTKTLFLQRAKNELGLKQIRVLPSRIEDLLADLAVTPGAERNAGHDEAGASIDAVAETGAGGLDASDGWSEPRLAAESDAEARAPLTPPYDGFTSRATLTLGPTLKHAADVVRPGGVAFLWKGSRLAEEAAKVTEWQAWWEFGATRTTSIEHSVVSSFIRRNE